MRLIVLAGEPYGTACCVDDLIKIRYSYSYRQANQTQFPCLPVMLPFFNRILRCTSVNWFTGQFSSLCHQIVVGKLVFCTRCTRRRLAQKGAEYADLFPVARFSASCQFSSFERLQRSLTLSLSLSLSLSLYIYIYIYIYIYMDKI